VPSVVERRLDVFGHFELRRAILVTRMVAGEPAVGREDPVERRAFNRFLG